MFGRLVLRLDVLRNVKMLRRKLLVDVGHPLLALLQIRLVRKSIERGNGLGSTANSAGLLLLRDSLRLLVDHCFQRGDTLQRVRVDPRGAGSGVGGGGTGSYGGTHCGGERR